MNEKKIISYFMSEIIDVGNETLGFLKRAPEFDNDAFVERNIKNIIYYARMIIEKDGAT